MTYRIMLQDDCVEQSGYGEENTHVDTIGDKQKYEIPVRHEFL